MKRMKGDEVKMYGRGRAWQLWHQNGTRCPKDTVPIKRVTIDDVLRTKSLNDFGRKQSKLALGRHAVSRQGHEVSGFETDLIGSRIRIPPIHILSIIVVYSLIQ